MLPAHHLRHQKIPKSLDNQRDLEHAINLLAPKLPKGIATARERFTGGDNDSVLLAASDSPAIGSRLPRQGVDKVHIIVLLVA